MGELKNRKRVNIILPINLVEWLKKYSDDTGIPMSRIIEKQLAEFKEKH